jgi:hypothetical protein
VPSKNESLGKTFGETFTKLSVSGWGTLKLSLWKKY